MATDVPTREELYETVDSHYREENPTAPEKIDLSQPGHEPWRDVWLAVRDRVLNDETNRIYWDTWPDAPVKIFPEDPDHAPYINSWNDIRARVLANQPMPATERSDRQADLDSGLSYIRAGIYEGFAEMLKATPSEMKDEVDAWSESLVEETMRALRAGKITADEEWTGNEQKVENQEDPPAKVSFYAKASVHDGQVVASIWWDFDDPKIEIDIDDEPNGEEEP